MSYEAYSAPTPPPEQTVAPTDKNSLALDLKPTIINYLQSTKNYEKIDGVKTCLAVMSKGEDVSEFFPLVVQHISSEDESLRHLTYIYLVHYAEQDPDSALMSVNTFQHLLQDSDPIARATALKILSSIRHPDIVAIVLDAVSKCEYDSSPYVKKAAALALVKLYETDPTVIDKLIPTLKHLLKDTSVIAISGALHAASIIAPDRDDLIHPVFRSLCLSIPKLDPWGQTIALRMLQRYARRNLRQPSAASDWFTDDELSVEMDGDLELLVKAAQPLLNSIVPSVTLAAASVFFYCAPSIKLQLIAKPLIRLVYKDPATAYIALTAISGFAADNEEPFVPHVRHFFLAVNDPVPIKVLKLQVMGQLARSSNSEVLMRELILHVTDPSKDVAAAAVRAVGRTAAAAGEYMVKCIDTVVRLLRSPSQAVLCQAARVLCLLLREFPHSENSEDSENSKKDDIFGGDAATLDSDDVVGFIKTLLRQFDRIEDAETIADVMGLVGDKASLAPEYAHELLRRAALSFPASERAVRLAAVSLAAKVLVVRPQAAQLVNYVVSLGALDADLDIRDRSRFLHALLASPTQDALLLQTRREARAFVLSQKPPVVWGAEVVRASTVEAGTLSQVVGRVLSKAAAAVPWADPQSLPPARVRDDVDEAEDLADGVEGVNAKEEEEDDFEDFLGEAPTGSNAGGEADNGDDGVEEEDDLDSYL